MFKVGDTVECIIEYPYRASDEPTQLGKRFIIKDINKDDECLIFDLDSNAGYSPKRFRLVKRNKIIVCRNPINEPGKKI